MLILDTHVLIWTIEEAAGLGKGAREHIAQALETGVFLSAISFWEIGMLVRKGRIRLNRPYSEWCDTISSHPAVMVLPVDAETAMEAAMLPEGVHGDPADRILMATARVNDMALLTVDRAILRHAEQGMVTIIDARH